MLVRDIRIRLLTFRKVSHGEGQDERGTHIPVVVTFAQWRKLAADTDGEFTSSKQLILISGSPTINWASAVLPAKTSKKVRATYAHWLPVSAGRLSSANLYRGANELSFFFSVWTLTLPFFEITSDPRKCYLNKNFVRFRCMGNAMDSKGAREALIPVDTHGC